MEILDHVSLSSNSSISEDGLCIEVIKLSRNSRRIRSKISVKASLDSIWNVITDYERLVDFIPGLALSQLIEKREKFARVYQIGEQRFAFGIKFNAKGNLDCYEKDIETLPFGKKREIEFKMTDGDFQLFEGKWSIEERNRKKGKEGETEKYETTLSYNVDVKPKMWLPVGLVEGRLCREIKLNLSCIREQVHKNIIH